MKTLIITHFKNQVLATNFNEAIEFINSLKGISANPSTIKNLQDYFELGKESYINVSFRNNRAFEIATTGCGTSRIICTKPLAKTLQEHNQILEEKKKEVEKIQNEKFQAKIASMHENKKGQYLVQLDCFESDLKKGGHKIRYTNWIVLAESQADAYNKAYKLAEDKGYFWMASMENCDIDFVGVWTDLTEEIYNS